MFKEKSGIEVVLVGKRLIAYDQNANKVANIKLPGYKWDVKKGEVTT